MLNSHHDDEAVITVEDLSASLDVGDVVDITITQVHNPSKFWIQLNSNLANLSSLEEDMRKTYEKSTRGYVLKETPLLGTFVAAQYKDYLPNSTFQGWHRAMVTGICRPHVAQVFYIDYGTDSIVPFDKLRHLLKKHASQLKAQAISARLSSIRPIDQDEWDVKAVNIFIAFATRTTRLGGCVACIEGFRHSGQDMFVSLWLVDTMSNDNPDGIKINMELVQKGLAIMDVGSQLRNCFNLEQELSEHHKDLIIGHHYSLEPLRMPQVAMVKEQFKKEWFIHQIKTGDIKLQLHNGVQRITGTLGDLLIVYSQVPFLLASDVIAKLSGSRCKQILRNNGILNNLPTLAVTITSSPILYREISHLMTRRSHLRRQELTLIPLKYIFELLDESTHQHVLFCEHIFNELLKNLSV